MIILEINKEVRKMIMFHASRRWDKH